MKNKASQNYKSLLSRVLRKICIAAKGLFRIELKFLKKGKGYQLDRFSYQKEYVDFNIEKGGKVLDIGSGQNPFPLATHLADFYEKETSHRFEALIRDERPFINCSIADMPFEDKYFDFVYCSNLLEHVENPAKSCEEIMRVGKRGYIETPTRMSDTMFNFASIKNHHKWFIEKLGNVLIFMEYDTEKMRDIKTNYYFEQFQSEWENPFQNLVRNNQDIFYNMFLWKGVFFYYVFDKNGNLISSNKNTKK
jgi:ubiquinone/menaquinone biosynthesis C-methylase UbiE